RLRGGRPGRRPRLLTGWCDIRRTAGVSRLVLASHQPAYAGRSPNPIMAAVKIPQGRTKTPAPPDPRDIVLQVAQTVPCTEAEGPGRRFALWFQGCPLRCPGCCNPEMLPFSGGTPCTVAALLDQIDGAACTQGVEGITLLGGEPLAHAA